MNVINVGHIRNVVVVFDLEIIVERILKKLILKKCPEIKGNVENAFKDFTVLCELGYDFDKLDC